MVWTTGISAPRQSQIAAFDPHIQAFSQQKANGNQTFACCKPIIDCLLGWLFYPADGSNMFLPKVSQILSEYTYEYMALYPKSY
jgi:hypothetical protein